MNMKALEKSLENIPTGQKKYFTQLFKKIEKKGEAPLKGKRIHVNWHLTDATVSLIVTLVKAGAEITTSAVDGLVSQQEVIDVLRKAGIPYFDSTQKVLAYYDENPCDVCLDCGAKLLNKELNGKKFKPKAFTVELTHTDPDLYKTIDHPVINIDNSVTKLIETKFGTGNAYIEGLVHFQKTSRDKLKEETYVVFGYGKVGSGIVNALKMMGVPLKNIIVIDKDPHARARAGFDGLMAYQLDEHDPVSIEKAKSAIKGKTYCVSATGKKGSLSEHFFAEDFENVKLANMSTEDDFDGLRYKNINDQRSADDLFVGRHRGILNFALKFPTEPKYLEAIFGLAYKTIESYFDPILKREPLSKGLNPAHSDDDEAMLNEYNDCYNFHFMKSISDSDMRLIPGSLLIQMMKKINPVGKSDSYVSPPRSITPSETSHRVTHMQRQGVFFSPQLTQKQNPQGQASPKRERSYSSKFTSVKKQALNVRSSENTETLFSRSDSDQSVPVRPGSPGRKSF